MNIGFLGVGEQGLQNLIPALQQIDDTRVVAVCDTSRKRAERAGARCGARVFESITEMLDTKFDGKQIDTVFAAAYPQVHIELAEQALARSIPVFVEKPPCYDRAQLVRLIELAKKAGVATGVGLNFRFATAIQRLQQLITSPEFGGIAYIDILHTANKPRMPLWDAASTTRAVLLAQTIHALDLAIALGGGQVADSSHRLVEESGNGVITEVSIEFQSGTLARVLSGNLFPDFTFFLRVVGRKGHLATINNFWELEYKAEGRSGPDGRDNKRWRDAWHPSPLDSGHARTGYVGELAGFLASVRSKERFMCDFASLIPTYDVIESICQPIESRSSGSAERVASGPAANT